MGSYLNIPAFYPFRLRSEFASFAHPSNESVVAPSNSFEEGKGALESTALCYSRLGVEPLVCEDVFLREFLNSKNRVEDLSTHSLAEEILAFHRRCDTKALRYLQEYDSPNPYELTLKNRQILSEKIPALAPYLLALKDLPIQFEVRTAVTADGKTYGQILFREGDSPSFATDYSSSVSPSPKGKKTDEISGFGGIRGWLMGNVLMIAFDLSLKLLLEKSGLLTSLSGGDYSHSQKQLAMAGVLVGTQQLLNVLKPPTARIPLSHFIQGFPLANAFGHLSQSLLTFAGIEPNRWYYPILHYPLASSPFLLAHYFPSLQAGIRSTAGVGLLRPGLSAGLTMAEVSALSGKNIFIAQGGLAGGAGAVGAVLQSANVFSAAIIGSSLGGMVVETAWKNATQNPEEALAQIVVENTLHKMGNWEEGGPLFGRNGFGFAVLGLSELVGIKTEIIYQQIENEIIQSANLWAEKMGELFLQKVLNSVEKEGSVPRVNWGRFRESWGQFTEQNRIPITTQYGISTTLSHASSTRERVSNVREILEVSSAPDLSLDLNPLKRYLKKNFADRLWGELRFLDESIQTLALQEKIVHRNSQGKWVFHSPRERPDLAEKIEAFKSSDEFKNLAQSQERIKAVLIELEGVSLPSHHK